MNIHQKLAELHLTLPPAPKPVAAYIPAVTAGGLVFISGQLPLDQGKLLSAGPVPSAVSIEQAQAAARQCALNAMAVLDQELAGDWSRFIRIVRIGVFVACEAGFTEQAKVANGASEFLALVLGEAGRHARATVGVPALPLGATVEVEMTVQVAQ